MRAFTIRSERIRDSLLEAIKDMPLEPLQRVVISKHINNKTANQRGWFHALCAIWGDELGMQAGDMKEIAKAKLFGWKQINYGGIMLTLADGRSEKLNAKEYGELIDTVYLLAGESGIELPPPDRFR
jgi:hypothetical protein